MPNPNSKKSNPLVHLCDDGTRIVCVDEQGRLIESWTAPGKLGYVVHPDDRRLRRQRVLAFLKFASVDPGTGMLAVGDDYQKHMRKKPDARRVRAKNRRRK